MPEPGLIRCQVCGQLKPLYLVETIRHNGQDIPTCRPCFTHEQRIRCCNGCDRLHYLEEIRMLPVINCEGEETGFELAYCTECIDNLHDCEQIEGRIVTRRATFYCDNCHREEYADEEHNQDTRHTVIDEGREQTWCESCFDENANYCSDCDQIYYDGDLIRVFEEYDIEEGYVNENSDFFICNSCREQRSDITYNDDLEEYIVISNNNNNGGNNNMNNWPIGALPDPNRIFMEHLDLEKATQICHLCRFNGERCSRCSKIRAEAKDKEETTLWIYDTEHCSYHTPDHEKFKHTILREPHERPYLYYGIELEVLFSNKADKVKVVHDFIVATNGLFVSEYDSSVDRLGNGAEFISRPLSYKKWMSPETRKLLAAGIKVLTDNGASIDQNDGCGLHVHLSRTFFEHNTKKKEKEIKNDIDWMFQIFQPEIEKISGRNYTDFCFAKKKMLERYIPDIKRGSGLNIEVKLKRGNLPSSENNHQNHHYAIVQTRRTIEIRTFKSTLDIDRILATIQFCRAIAHASRNMDINTKTTFGEIINCKEGPQLTELVNKLKLDTSKTFKTTLEV